jgi:hypothetical protein
VGKAQATHQVVHDGPPVEVAIEDDRRPVAEQGPSPLERDPVGAEEAPLRDVTFLPLLKIELVEQAVDGNVLAADPPG